MGRHDPHVDLRREVLGEPDRHIIFIQSADRLVKHNMLRVDERILCRQRCGDLCRADRAVKMAFLVGPGRDRDLFPLDGCHPGLLGCSILGQSLQESLLIGFDGLDVGVGRFNGQAIRKKIVPRISRFDLDNVADGA